MIKITQFCVCRRVHTIKKIKKNNTWLADLKLEALTKKRKRHSKNDDTEKCIDDKPEDKRLGVTFAIEPLTGRKFFKLSDYDDKLSWCEMIKDLVDNKYPDAEKITLVMNKDDVVLISMLEVCFSAEDALRIYQKLDIHPITNRHGWLNISNIEAIEVLRKCLCKGIQNVSAHWCTVECAIYESFSGISNGRMRILSVLIRFEEL